MNPDLLVAATTLYTAIEAAPVPQFAIGAEQAQDARRDTLQQASDFVLRRLRYPDAPLLVVVGGPSGAGKSTIVNAVVGEEVTRSGVFRPTTRSPVLVHHPSDALWFSSKDSVVGRLAGIDDESGVPTRMSAVATSGIPRGIALLDSPDFDSVDEDNRRIAIRLLAAADLWMYVTTPARDADSVPWTQLTEASRRGKPVCVVLNRLSPEDTEIVSRDLAAMMRGSEVVDDGLMTVSTVQLGARDSLPEEAAHAVRAFLDELAANDLRRRDIVERSIVGSLHLATSRALQDASLIEAEVHAAVHTLHMVDAVYDQAKAELRVAITDGTMVSGRLRSLWDDLHGVVDAPLNFEGSLSAFHGRSFDADPTVAAAVGRLESAFDLALQAVVVEHAERAAASVAALLTSSGHGQAILSRGSDNLLRVSPGLAEHVRTGLRKWRESLRDAVAAANDVQTVSGHVGMVRRRSVAIALAIAVVDSRNPVVGLDDLVERFADSLIEVASALLDAERARFVRPVAGLSLNSDASRQLRAAAGAVAALVDRSKDV